MTTNAKELFSGGIPLSHPCLIVATTGAHVAVTLEYLQDFERAVRVDGIKEALSIIMSAHHEQLTSIRDRIKELESQQPT